jgi:elongator complex protein 3
MDNQESLFFNELISIIIDENISSKTKLNNLKTKLAKKHGIKKVVKNQDIIAFANDKQRNKVIKLLKVKPVRDISGVTVVALFAKPHKCPHGKCIYCPGGIDSDFGDTPQSYTGAEPAAMRAIRNDYDPYLQIFNRLEHYVVNGKIPDKLELIFMGGTFPSLDKKYRDEFVNFVYKAINDFGNKFIYFDDNGNKQVKTDKFNNFFETKKDLNSVRRGINIKRKVLKLKKRKVRSYKEEILDCETSIIRPIGLTIETKPDWALKEHLNDALEYGTTRLEIGVQSLDNEILRKVGRGHGVSEIVKSFQEAKDMCFKINAHMMVNLPYSNLDNDLLSLKHLYFDESFKPDMLKIYPCLVTKGTHLYKMWKEGEYEAIGTEEIAKVLAKAFEYFPRWTRVMRIQRDIPTPNIEAGVKKSNLRQYVDKYMIKAGTVSKDIREREVGFRLMNNYKLGEFNLNIEEYDASEGKEFFIDVVDKNDTMIGFCRLRFPSKFDLREEIDEETALIRELHVYGSTLSVGEKGDGLQHKGWGKKLVQKAEEIAKNKGYIKIAVISGIGVREYYKKLGYEKEGVYMCKYIGI